MKLFRLIASLLVPSSIVLASFTAAPAAGAEPEMSLKDRQQWDEMTKHIEDKARLASEKCGTTITAKFDIPSFKGQDLFRQSPTAGCRDAINTLTAICAKDSGKAAVKKNVATVTCKRSADGTKVTREGTELSVQLDPAKRGITSKSGATSWKTALEEIL
jgi:hypothetical protein